MKNIYRTLRYLGIGATIILPILVLTSCNKISTCEEVQIQKVQNISVQLSEPIYSRVFGSKSCSPRKLELRLPVNSPIENPDKKSTNQTYTPKITTLVTFSSKYENFSIIRLDQKANGWIYTESDSCLSWKWSQEDKGQNLILSMERNLQIRNPNIKSVIFILSLPLEIKEARELDLILKRYTWEKDTSRVGDIYNFNRKDYPEILAILKERERGTRNDSNAFGAGKPVSNEIAEELQNIGDKGGVYLIQEFASKKPRLDKESYHDSPESPACRIPDDLKQL